MKRKILFLSLTFFCLSITEASPYWIWSRKTGGWANPRAALKGTPEKQLEYAKDFYQEKQYEEAEREFKKLLNKYPKSAEASESQYYLGRIAEDKKSLYQAFKAYQKVIDKYPFSERIQEIIERQYNIAEEFMPGAGRRAALTVENPAIEIFGKVIENSYYGPLAPKAQYKLGLLLKELLRYYEAENAFNKVISNYPDSEWAKASEFQIASCRAALSRGPDYDQGATQDAKEKFQEFVKSHPDAVLSREAEENILRLKEKEAESNYSIACFYEKQKEYDAAAIYYGDVVDNYPASKWAAPALERLQVIEKRR